MPGLSKAWMATVFAIIGLLVGGLLTYAVFPKEVIKEVPKEVPKEVIKEVPVEIIKEIPLDATVTYLDAAIAAFIDEGLEDLAECGTEEYDEDQIVVKKVYDDWSVVFGEDRHGDPQYSVDFNTKLKFLDNDIEEKCYKNCDVSVLYREDKSPKVIFSCNQK